MWLVLRPSRCHPAGAFQNATAQESSDENDCLHECHTCGTPFGDVSQHLVYWGQRGGRGRACDCDSYSVSRHTPNVADLAIVSRYVISISDAGHNSAILPGITIVTTSHNVDIPAQLLQCSGSTCSNEHGEVLVHVVFGLRLGGCAYWEGL